MQDYMYSAISFLAIAIHLIINFDLLHGRGADLSTVHARRYRDFLACLLAYYVVDALWGIFAGLGWTRALFLDTTLYFVTLSASVLAWCLFVTAYLGIARRPARLLSGFGWGLLAFNLATLAANPFTPVFFGFDARGAYVEGPLRNLSFSLLAAFNALMAVCVFAKALGNRDAGRGRNVKVFLFCLTMTVAIVLQIVWPLLPLYALGCLVGSCFFHVFVVEDERAELRKAVIEREQTAKHMAELEKALERARAAEKARSMFFSIVSHDIRTPLNAILGYSELLRRGLDSQAERDEALESIRASGTTLLELVNDVLDLAKMDAGKMPLRPVPVRLAPLADDVFASFRLAAAEREIVLVNRTEGVPAVLLDEHRFRQILFNLIGNAVKFTECGTVTVSAAHSGTTLEVSVSDTGCGIPPDMLTRILDPFVQVRDPSHSPDRAGGTGLGLSICKRLVEAMGGELEVSSELGKGSTFTARIPDIAPAGEPPESVPAPPPPPPSPSNLPARVLVVDDSPVNRAVLAAFLKKAGVSAIDHAADGAEALDALDAAARAGRPHDFVFSDLWMPNVSGLEFIEKLRADPRFARLPVYAVTADTEAARDPRTPLFTGVLLKPLTYSKLLGVFSPPP